MNNPLCPMLALLTLAPHPLSPLEVGVVLGLREDDCRRGLLLLAEAGRVVEVRGRYTVPATREVITEAVSAMRRQHREREIAVLSARLEAAVNDALAFRRSGTTSAGVATIPSRPPLRLPAPATAAAR